MDALTLLFGLILAVSLFTIFSVARRMGEMAIELEKLDIYHTRLEATTYARLARMEKTIKEAGVTRLYTTQGFEAIVQRLEVLEEESAEMRRQEFVRAQRLEGLESAFTEMGEGILNIGMELQRLDENNTQCRNELVDLGRVVNDMHVALLKYL